MPRPRSTAPSKWWDKTKRQFCLMLRTANGRRIRYTLGTDEPEAERQRLALIAEWLAARGRARPIRPDHADPTVAEAVAAYRAALPELARDPDHQARTRLAIEVVADLYGPEPAREFGPKKLKAVRQHLLTLGDRRMKSGLCAHDAHNPRISESATDLQSGEKTSQGGGQTSLSTPSPLSRTYVNKLVRCIQVTWRWLASEELVPAAQAAALVTVTPLRAGQGGREVEKIHAADPVTVAAVLAVCHPILAAMIRVQLACGMRPGEVVRMRGCDLSRSPDQPVTRPGLPPARAVTVDGMEVWAFVPERSKGDHINRPRIIAVPPEAQAVLGPFLAGREPTAYLFSPAEAIAHWRASQRQQRRSKVQPSQADRSKDRPRKQPGIRYTTGSFTRALQAACRKAGVEEFAANRLRKLRATDLYDTGGLVAAQAVLGHAAGSGVTMRHYVEQTLRAAAQALAKEQRAG